MNLIKKLFTKEDLSAIADAIGAAEKKTAGEIRVSIRHRRHLNERSWTVEQLARKEFHHLGMTKTKERIGILIFLLLKDHSFYILADEGIHSKVAEGTWTAIAAEMSSHFSKNNFRAGVLHGVQEVAAVLAKNFPPQPGDINELPNEVNID